MSIGSGGTELTPDCSGRTGVNEPLADSTPLTRQRLAAAAVAGLVLAVAALLLYVAWPWLSRLPDDLNVPVLLGLAVLGLDLSRSAYRKLLGRLDPSQVKERVTRPPTSRSAFAQAALFGLSATAAGALAWTSGRWSDRILCAGFALAALFQARQGIKLRSTCGPVNSELSEHHRAS